MSFLQGPDRGFGWSGWVAQATLRGESGPKVAPSGDYEIGEEPVQTGQGLQPAWTDAKP